MKKITIALIVLFTVFPDCSKNIQETEIQSPRMDIDSILNNVFSDSSLMHGISLKFNKQKSTYDFDYGSEGLYWHDVGKFLIVGDRIELKPSKCEPECNQSFGKGFCEIKPRNESYSHKLSLNCYSNSNNYLLHTNAKNKSATFDIRQSAYSENEIIFYKGKEYRSVGGKNGTTIDNVKIRKEPNVNAGELQFSTDLYGPYLSHIPKNTSVKLYMRTIEKDKVKQWENYWYFVETASTSGWVFGEFIKFK